MAPPNPGTPGSDPSPEPRPEARPKLEATAWSRLQQLFNEAVDLDAAARENFLANLPAEDAPLVGELRSLLAAHGAASGFLAEPAMTSGWSAAPGDRIGPYRVIEEIGHGGMGIVYRAARDDASFQKDVAIKAIDATLRSAEILKRFHAERQILAMLEHPSIARLLDGGATPDGSPYLVMEYVAGVPLTEYCDTRALRIEARLQIFLAVCDAVQFAHGRLVVHRDLKPDNILVMEDGTPRLLDFGIAKLLSPEDGGPIGTVTAPMNRVFTPDYASPEQVRGEPATVAGDVYSLGVILYELLSGARPYRFTTRSPEEVLRVVMEADPAPPSSVITARTSVETVQRRDETASHLKKRLAGDLDYIVLKALEKDPQRRYASVDRLSQDIRRHLGGFPVLARGRSTAYRVSRFVRRHRAAVVTSCVVVISLLAGLAGMAWQARVAQQERDRAKRRFEDVRALAHAVMFDIHDAIADLPGSTKAREILVEHALRYLDGLSREAASDHSLQHEVAVAYGKIGDVQGRPMFPNLGQSNKALASYETALAMLETASRAEPESTRYTHDLIAVSLRRADLLSVMGRPEEALQETEAARQRIVEEMARHPGDGMFEGDMCVALGRLVIMRQAANDTLGAVRECAEYVDLADRMFLAEPTDAGRRRGALISSTKMAELHAWRGQPDSASASFRHAEELAETAVQALPLNTEASRDLSIVYGMHGLFLAESGHLDEGLRVYDRGMKIAEEMAAADPNNALQQADVAAGHFEIGSMLLNGGRPRDAESRFAEAYRRYGQLAAADSGNVENRVYMARSARGAGEACRVLWLAAPHDPARGSDRARARNWFETSHTLYKPLAAAGALAGDEKLAVPELEGMLAELR